LNEIQAKNLLGDFEFASDEEISALDLKKGFIGVKDLSIEIELSPPILPLSANTGR
jgi:hypothetical protein